MHICVVRVSMFWHSQISILQLSSKTQIIWPIHQKCIQNLYTSNGTAAQGENFEMDLIKEDQIKMPTPRFFYSSEEDFTPNHFLEKTNSHPSAFRLQPDPPIWTQNGIWIKNRFLKQKWNLKQWLSFQPKTCLEAWYILLLQSCSAKSWFIFPVADLINFPFSLVHSVEKRQKNLKWLSLESPLGLLGSVVEWFFLN